MALEREEPGVGALLIRALAGLGLLAALLNAALAFRDAWGVKVRVDGSQHALSCARDHNERLRRHIQALRSSPQAVESALRMRRRLRPGEEVLPPR
jgi:hypothetical protein